MPHRRRPSDVVGNLTPQTQSNFTDPGSHILKGSDNWIQGYNAQAADGGAHHLIVAIGVSNHPSGVVHLLSMPERFLANNGQLPELLTADAGYCSTAIL
jgi:hypothetical protein